MVLSRKVAGYISAVLLMHFVVLASVYFDIPILRQVMVFAYLSFLPGFLLLIALKTQKTDILKLVLLSIGLSIAILMFVGFFVNVLYPVLGISRPLSTTSLMLTMTGLTLALFVVGLKRDVEAPLDLIEFENRLPTRIFVKAIPFAFLPVIGIIGAIYRDFAVPLLIIAIAVLFVLCMVSTRLIPPKLYPFLIFVICLALALQFTLMSQHVMGNDAPLEYRVYQLTAIDGVWSPLNSGSQIEIYYTSMLSITILPTIFSVLLNINGELLFKILYPLLFCLVPLTLYRTLSTQGWKASTSLLAVFFFISSPLVFYGSEPLSIERQIVGELFLILSIFLILDVKDTSNTKNLFLVVFGAALVVSHYSLTFIYLGYLVFMLIVSMIGRKSTPVLSAKFVLLMLVVALGWYISYASPMLQEINSSFRSIVSNFQTDLTNPAARSAELFVAHPVSNIASPINWVVFAAAHFLIIVGVLLVFLKPNYVKINFRYRVMIIFSGMLFFVIFVVPNFAPILNFSRFYAITMLFLAPCFVIGGESILVLFKKIFVKITRKQYNWKFESTLSVLLIAILVSCYFLSQAGFVNHVTGGSTLSFTLDWDKALNLNMSTSFEPGVKVNFYNAFTPDQDVKSATWLSMFMANNSLIYADSIAIFHPLHIFALISDNNLVDLMNYTKLTNSSYVYLRTFNVENGYIIPKYTPAYNISDINPELSNCNLLYTNGQSLIYRSTG
jgi:uncharacterized membrane protein